MMKNFFFIPLIEKSEELPAFISIIKKAFITHKHLVVNDLFPISNEDLLSRGKFDDDSYALLNNYIQNGMLNLKQLFVSEDTFILPILTLETVKLRYLQTFYN